jgi:hypothetical protein
MTFVDDRSLSLWGADVHSSGAGFDNRQLLESVPF